MVFYSFVMVQNIEREENAQADALFKLVASVVEEFKVSAYIKVLAEPRTTQQAVLNIRDDRSMG